MAGQEAWAGGLRALKVFSALGSGLPRFLPQLLASSAGRTRHTVNAPLRRVVDAGNLFGVNLAVLARSILGIPKLIQDSIEYKKGDPPASFKISLRHLMPMLTDYRGGASAARGHYFHQDLWAARKIFVRRPTSHIDVGARIDGFIAHLLVFMDVEIRDILPFGGAVRGLHFRQCDATSLG